MEGKQEDMCALFVMHKQEAGRVGDGSGDGGGSGGGTGGVVGRGVHTNQHPPPLSHANEAVGITRTLLLP